MESQVLLVGVASMHVIACNRDVLNLPFLDFVQELGEGQLLLLVALAGSHHGEQQHSDTNEYHPKNCSLDIRIHETSKPACPSSLDVVPVTADSDFLNLQIT